MRFTGKVFLVSGASSGIGLSAAKRLSSEGAAIMAVARSAERLASAKPQGASDWRSISCDLTDEGSVRCLVEDLRGQRVVLDGVVHCAGVHALRPLRLLGADELIRMFNSHVVSAVSLVRHLVNSRLFGANGASIVLMSSVAALRGGSGAAAYSAAKGAIISMGRALAVELASRRIRVNVVIPGVVRTPMANALFESMTPEQRMELEKNHLLGIAEPEDLAGPIAFLLSDDARCITGTSLVVDSGLTAH